MIAEGFRWVMNIPVWVEWGRNIQPFSFLEGPDKNSAIEIRVFFFVVVFFSFSLGGVTGEFWWSVFAHPTWYDGMCKKGFLKFTEVLFPWMIWCKVNPRYLCVETFWMAVWEKSVVELKGEGLLVNFIFMFGNLTFYLPHLISCFVYYHVVVWTYIVTQAFNFSYNCTFLQSSAQNV